jgi:hypothetical protein
VRSPPRRAVSQTILAFLGLFEGLCGGGLIGLGGLSCSGTQLKEARTT